MLSKASVHAGGSLWPPQSRLCASLDATRDPVSAANGGLYFDLPLLETGGPMALDVWLHYDLNGAKALFGLRDLPAFGKWSWSPMAVCVPGEIDGTNYVQFRVGGLGAIAFVEQTNDAWRLTEPGDFGVATAASPIPFAMCWTNDWIYLADPRSERVLCFEPTNSDWRIKAAVNAFGDALIYSYDTNVQDKLQPVRIEDLDGRYINITYTNYSSFNSYLYSLTDQSGRQVVLTYEDGEDTYRNNLALRTVVDARGFTNVFSYTYNTNAGSGALTGLLAGYQYPRGNTPWQQTYHGYELYPDDGYPHPVVSNQVDAYGNIVSFAYDTNAHTVATSWPDGASNVFEHTGRFGVPVDVSTADGLMTAFEHDAHQHPAGMTDPGSTRFAAGFDGGHRWMAALTNASGEVLSFGYATASTAFTNPVNPAERVVFSFARIADIYYPDGTSERYAYDSRGSVTSVIDRAGCPVYYDRNPRGQVAAIRTPEGLQSVFTYNTMGLLTNNADADGAFVELERDALGRITNRLDGSGVHWALSYNADNQLTRITDGRGAVVEYAYDANGNLSAVHQPDGAQTGVGRDLMDRITALTNALGGVSRFSYDSMGRPASVTRPHGIVISNFYDVHGALTNRMSGGVSENYEYDFEGRLTQYQVDDRTPVTLSRDAEGRIVAVSNGLGHVENFLRDEAGRLTNYVNPLGYRSTRNYYNGRLTADIDAVGRTTMYDYDDAGRLSMVVAPDGGLTLYGYSPAGRLSGLTNAMGHRTLYGYDAGGRLAAITTALNTAHAWRYDNAGRTSAYTDALTNTWRYGRDAAGRLTSVTNPRGGVVAVTRLPGGRMATRTDTDTGIWSNSWDGAGRLTRVVDPQGGITHYGYDAFNRLAAVTNPLGHSVHYGYDAAGALVRATDPLGKEVLLVRDAMGRVTSVVNRVGGILQVNYDAASRLSEITDPDGVNTVFSRDPTGLVLEQTVGGHTWSNRYDAAGRLIRVTTPSGRTNHLTYNRLGLLTNRMDSGGGNMAWGYDALGRLLSVTDEEGRRRAYEYDAAGHITRASLPDGRRVEYERDALGNVTRLADLGSNAWCRSYSAMGRLVADVDPLGRTNRYVRDASGRMAARIYPDGSSVYLHRNGTGLVTSRVYSAGCSLFRRYDEAGRLIDTDGLSLERDAAGRITNAWINGKNYAAAWSKAGRLQSVSYAGGALRVLYGYDPVDGRLISVSDDQSGTTVNLEYDDDGRIEAIRRPHGQDSHFTYDDAGRLTRIQSEPGIDLVYVLDRSGRLLSEQRTVPELVSTQLVHRTDAHTYDAASQLDMPEADYNLRGERLLDDRHVYQYDPVGNLTVLDRLTNSYNGAGQLIERDGVSMACHPSIQGSPLVDDAENYYVWTPGGELLYLISQAGTNAYHYRFDRNGNVIALVDATGALVQAHAYMPYGERVGSENYTLQQPFRFLGRYGTRAEGDLYHLRTRWYDARSGAFLSKDPAGRQANRPHSVNPYLYASANPVNHADGDNMSVAETNQIFGKQPKMMPPEMNGPLAGIEPTGVEFDWLHDHSSSDPGAVAPDNDLWEYAEDDPLWQKVAAGAAPNNDLWKSGQGGGSFQKVPGLAIPNNDLWKYTQGGTSFQKVEHRGGGIPDNDLWKYGQGGTSFQKVPGIAAPNNDLWKYTQGEALFQTVENHGGGVPKNDLWRYGQGGTSFQKVTGIAAPDNDLWKYTQGGTSFQRIDEESSGDVKNKPWRFTEGGITWSEVSRLTPKQRADRVVKSHIGTGRKRDLWWELYQRLNPRDVRLVSDWNGSDASLEFSPLKLHNAP